MPRYSRPPLSMTDLAQDGPAVRVRDLVAITGLSWDTIATDIKTGHLSATKRIGRTALYLVSRSEARRYVAQMFHGEQKPRTTGIYRELQPAS